MTMSELEKAAISWWRCKRPVALTLDEHLRNPTINTVTKRENRLAREVARLVAKMRRRKMYCALSAKP